MRATTSKALRKLHLLLDAAVVVTAMLLAARLHAVLRELVPALRQLPRFEEYAALAYLALPLWLGLVLVLRLNRSFEAPWTTASLLLGLIKLHAAGLLGLSLIHFLARATVNRSLVASFLVCSFALMYALRLVLDRWARYQHRQGVSQRRMVLVGTPCKRMADFVRDARTQPLPPNLLGCLRAAPGAGERSTPPADFAKLSQLPDLGELSVPRLAELLHEEAVDEVLFFAPCDRPEQLGDCIAVCEELGITASFAVNLVQVARAAPRITAICDHPFVTFDVAPKQPELLALKHGLDPIVAGLLIVLLLPVFLVTALAILLSMGRPIFFTQPRAGLHGRPFSMFKFRSMVASGGAARDAPQAKAKNDPRVTPLGRILRKTSLDELPQLVNVLFGSMSLVGPRPLPLAEQRELRNWQRRRLSMKPGITGLWQVSGRSQLDFEEWMALDLKYIDDWSPVLDLLILLRTIPVVLLGRGAH